MTYKKNATKNGTSGQDTIYKMVTDRIVDQLKAGTVPWHKPWTSNGVGFPLSMSTKKPYRGINVFLLALTAMDEGFTSQWWGTYKHIAELGGTIKEGGATPHTHDNKPGETCDKQHGTVIVFWKVSPRKPREDENPAGHYSWFLLRYYRVFNADQCEGLPEKFYPQPTDPDHEVEPIEEAEKVLHDYINRGPGLVHTGDRAYYRWDTDTIYIPAVEDFDDMAAYYSTAFHESTHSTGYEKRLGRQGIVEFDHFGSSKYGKEELIAEMGAAMLTAITGTDAHWTNSAAYVASWLKTIEGDPKLVISAAAAAQKAVDYILGTEFDHAEPSNGDDH